MARHYGATVVATASVAKHHAVRALGVDHVLDHRTADLAGDVRRLTGGAGADLVLESVGGTTLHASLAAARRVTGRVVVYGMPGGVAAVSNRELIFTHPVHVVGLHIGAMAEHAPATFADLMTELAALRAAGVHTPGGPTVHPLTDGPAVLADLAAGVTVGKLALRP
jgi:NADPH2:quinone reductase